MSTIEQKYILGLGKLAIHFSTAADGSESVALSPITPESFENSETGLIIFDSEQQASDRKDKLCTIAADLESPTCRSKKFVPHTLETYCNLQIMPLPELAVA